MGKARRLTGVAFGAVVAALLPLGLATIAILAAGPPSVTRVRA